MTEAENKGIDAGKLQKMDNRYFLFGLLNAFMNRLQAQGDIFFEEISWKQCFAMICLQLFEAPPTIRELSQVMGSSHQNVKQLLLKLQAKSYVNLNSDEHDKRKQRISITPEGIEFLRKYDKPSDDFIMELYQGIDASNMLMTISTISKMESNLKGWSGSDKEDMKNEDNRSI